MLSFDAQSHRYPSVRNVVFARRGMACSTQPLASSLGIDVMKRGGNAIDAAVAMAGAMALLEPTSNGLGSDAFFLVWTQGKLYGLNASGYAPAALNAEYVRKLGYEKMPSDGWLPVMVPGAAAGWCELSRRFGTMPLTALWEPVAAYGEEGFPVSPATASSWERAYERFLKAYEKEPELFAPWMDCFGTVPKGGELFKNPEFSRTLRELARTKGESFYRGSIAGKIAAFSEKTGGYLSREDLARYYPEWVEPIHAAYRGYEVWEMPPNGHGITALMALRILNGFDLGKQKENPLL